MAFNAGTYRANRWAKDAKRHLAKARDIKARAERGEAYSWESIASEVRLARSANRLALSQRRINAIMKGLKA